MNIVTQNVYPSKSRPVPQGRQIQTVPTVVMHIHKQSVIVHVSEGGVVSSSGEKHKRSDIKEFTTKSFKRGRLLLENTIDLYKAYLVLTYPKEFPGTGRKTTRDRRAMVMYLKRQGIKDYWWGLEFQERGAPHLNFLLPEMIDIEKVKRAWYKIVNSGDPLHLQHGASIELIRDASKLKSYVVGYQTKKQQKDVPEEYKEVGRFWGSSRKLKEVARYSYSFKNNEKMLQAIEPIINLYKAERKAWSDAAVGKGKKPYDRFKLKTGFTWWGSAHIVKALIEMGVLNENIPSC